MAAFALETPDPEPFHRLELAGPAGRRAIVTLAEHAARVRIAARVTDHRHEGDAWHVEQSTRIELDLAAPAMCARDRSWRAWDLLSGPAHELGPFRDLVWWLEWHLFGPDVRWGSADERAVVELCDLAARCATAACEPEAREVALRFVPGARFLVYAALVGDASGRARQIVETCPVLLTYCAYFGPSDPRTLRVLDGIQRGARLRNLLDLVSAGSGMPARTLLRRAPAGLEIAELDRVTKAPGIDVNDVPSAPDDWYRMMARWGAVAAYVVDTRVAARIGGFLSRHAAEATCVGPEELVDYVLMGGGAGPCRRSSTRAVRRALDLWHDRGPAGPIDRARVLPPPPVSTVVVPALALRAIGTLGELHDEGSVMLSCVGSFGALALSGSLTFFRGTVLGQRCTVCVQRGDSGWILREAAGVANARLDARQLRMIRDWTEQLREP